MPKTDFPTSRSLVARLTHHGASKSWLESGRKLHFNMPGGYGLATISRLLEITSRFWRILSLRALLQKRPIILRSLLIVATPYIDCLLYIIAKHPAWSGELTGGSQWTSVTVYTKHVHVMFNQQTVNPLQTLGAQIRTSSQKKILKELYSKSANCSRTLPKTGLSVTSFLVYAAVARRSAHELSHD